MTLVPVSVLTGFLGSGKTSLLNTLLKSPMLSNACVVINEFGEIGLDHLLVEKSDETIVELSSGCLCCTIRGDLIDTLNSLLDKRSAGTLKAFDRVVIETTGLADPAPVLHALMRDDLLLQRVKLEGVITVVDGFNGMATLDAHPEAVKQVAMADRIVLTKLDLLEGKPGEDMLFAIIARLRKLNPSARLSICSIPDFMMPRPNQLMCRGGLRLKAWSALKMPATTTTPRGTTAISGLMRFATSAQSRPRAWSCFSNC
jgi:G3E family GTPase